MSTDKTAALYILQGLAIVILMIIVCLIVTHLLDTVDLNVAIVVSSGYALVVELLDAIVWRKVKKSSPDSLPTFFMGASMIRLLTAIMVITIYYFASGRGDMLTFFLVFMAFYLAILIHHSVFFSHIQK